MYTYVINSGVDGAEEEVKDASGYRLADGYFHFFDQNNEVKFTIASKQVLTVERTE